MTYIGLLFELLFFAAGIYLYLFSRGKIRAGNPRTQTKFDDFRRQNGGWMRIAGLALAAIMLVNLFFHLWELFH